MLPMRLSGALAVVLAGALLAAPPPASAAPAWHSVDQADAGCSLNSLIVGQVGFYYDERRPPQINEYVPVRLMAANSTPFDPCPLDVQFEATLSGSWAVFGEAPILCGESVLGGGATGPVFRACGARGRPGTFVKERFTGGSPLRVEPRGGIAWALPNAAVREVRLGAIFHAPRRGDGMAIGAAWKFTRRPDAPAGPPAASFSRALDLPIRPGKPLAVNWATSTSAEVAASGYAILPAASRSGTVKARLTVAPTAARALGLTDAAATRRLVLARAQTRIKANSAKRVVLRIPSKRARHALRRATATTLRKARFAVHAELLRPNGKHITRVNQPVTITRQTADSAARP